MIVHTCSAVKSNCWNLADSYGEICVHCGCCSSNKKTRYKARLEHYKRCLKEKEGFSDWAYEYPDLVELQKKNIAEDIKYFKRRIRYYENKLKNLNNA